MVAGNQPTPFEKTGGSPNAYKHLSNSKGVMTAWNKFYQERAKISGAFLACRKIYMELNQHPAFTEELSLQILGRPTPSIQNYKKISIEQFEAIKTITNT